MRVVKRDGSIGPPAPRKRQCPPHVFNYIKRVNGTAAGPVRCSNCGAPTCEHNAAWNGPPCANCQVT